MRYRLLLATLAVWIFAGPAHGASLPFSGSLSLVISTLPAISVSGSGVATLNGSGGGGHLSSMQLAGGTFAGTASLPVTDPGVFPILGVVASFLNGPGSFTLGGKMGVAGIAQVCLFAVCTAPPPANLNIPFTQSGTRGIGLGGGPVTSMGAVNITVLGAPWTLGTVSLPVPGGGSLTQMGFVHGPASGGQSSAANASGALQLVTPVLIQTSIGGAAVIPAFGVLSLHFIPEPGSMLLLATGLTGLALFGRARMSR